MRPLPALVLTLVAGCASGGSTAAAVPASAAPAVAPPATQSSATRSSTPSVSQSFVASFDRVWRTLPDAYASLGIKVNVADTATRAVGFAGQVHRKLGRVAISKYFDCGMAQTENIADSYDITVFVASQVGRSSEGRIIVTMHARASGRAPEFAHDNAYCSSTGTLERALFDSLKARLGQR